jgi:hypothetical protein
MSTSSCGCSRMRSCRTSADVPTHVVADHPTQRWTSTARTGPDGGWSRSCGYLSLNERIARSASAVSLTRRAAPSSRTHQSRDQSSSYSSTSRLAAPWP